MQKLQFEQKWAKAIAPEDRLHIETLFHQTQNMEQSVIFTPIRTAINHEKALLVSVLVHNRCAESLVFQEREITCLEKDKFVDTQLFTITRLNIPPYTSMPWTFIFKGIINVDELDLAQITLR